MEPVEIYQKLKAKFGDKIVQISPDDVLGDRFCVVKPEAICEVCSFVRDDNDLLFDFLTCLSGIDDGKILYVVYHLYSTKKNHMAIFKVSIDRASPMLPTVTDIWAGANWHEREIYDLFGIKFIGHPNLQRILLPDNWEGHPLRKDYIYPKRFEDISLE